MTYQQAEFGYGSKDVGGIPRQRVPDLSGRWAFVDAHVESGLPEPSSFPMPLVFDIVLTYDGSTLGPIVMGPKPPTYVTFSLRDIEGQQFAEMRCDYMDENNWLVDELVCNLNMPNLEDGEAPFSVEVLSIERIMMGFTGPSLSVGSPPQGTAVRID